MQAFDDLTFHNKLGSLRNQLCESACWATCSERKSCRGGSNLVAGKHVAVLQRAGHDFRYCIETTWLLPSGAPRRRRWRRRGRRHGAACCGRACTCSHPRRRTMPSSQTTALTTPAQVLCRCGTSE